MKSKIINKFYTQLEKLGLKKHKVSKEEYDFLDGLSDFEQLKLLDDEDIYNLRRVRIKFYAMRSVAILLVITGLSIITINWLLTVVLIVFSVVAFIISKHLNNRLFAISGSRGIMRAIHKYKMEEIFK